MDIRNLNQLYDNKPKSQLDRSTHVHKTSTGSVTITGGSLEHKHAWKTPDTLRDEGVTIQNTMSSIAGAGSGEFHIYRQRKKAEELRLKKMEIEATEEKERREFEERQKQREEKSEKRSEKGRKKRDKQKQKKQMQKALKQLDKKSLQLQCEKEKEANNSQKQTEDSNDDNEARGSSQPEKNTLETKRLRVEKEH